MKGRKMKTGYEIVVCAVEAMIYGLHDGKAIYRHTYLYRGEDEQQWLDDLAALRDGADPCGWDGDDGQGEYDAWDDAQRYGGEYYKNCGIDELIADAKAANDD